MSKTWPLLVFVSPKFRVEESLLKTHVACVFYESKCICSMLIWLSSKQKCVLKIRNKLVKQANLATTDGFRLCDVAHASFIMWLIWNLWVMPCCNINQKVTQINPFDHYEWFMVWLELFSLSSNVQVHTYATLNHKLCSFSVYGGGRISSFRRLSW
jgi:hypothetical protein